MSEHLHVYISVAVAALLTALFVIAPPSVPVMGAKTPSNPTAVSTPASSSSGGAANYGVGCGG